MAWLDNVDIYCERTDPAFWAEPVNAWSNLGFLVVAGLAYRHWLRRGIADYPVLGLIGLVGLIGIGSFLFHTIATNLAALADVIPITLFVLCYLFLALRRFLKVPLAPSIALVAGFAILSEALSSAVPAALVNGSEAYLPALAALVAIAIATPDRVIRKSLLSAAAIFSVSLAFRTIDIATCAAWPLGTHFVWHLMNAVVLYKLVMIQDARDRSGAPASRCEYTTG